MVGRLEYQICNLHHPQQRYLQIQRKKKSRENFQGSLCVHWVSHLETMPKSLSKNDEKTQNSNENEKVL